MQNQQYTNNKKIRSNCDSENGYKVMSFFKKITNKTKKAHNESCELFFISIFVFFIFKSLLLLY